LAGILIGFLNSKVFLLFALRVVQLNQKEGSTIIKSTAEERKKEGEWRG